ncbi:NAD(P)/FAD-dependent oxidoreductase [Luteimonas vadosa]|uniref:NAD(P)/FAD-dependent oxidoreductase n=1 Tax=Luteimonas vadosa TaxID=1165507 RepID=A0ABP9DV73_9GAMM
MTEEDPILDALVIGAGPAGLTAATYLSRFKRRIAVVDAGNSRARWIPTSHNCPGFPSGVTGDALLDKLREQARAYGTEIVGDRVSGLERDGDAFHAVGEQGGRWAARYVLLATGIVDCVPKMARLEQAIENGAIRLCAVCDGYEACDERIAVYAPVDEAIRHALFLRTFSREVLAVRSEAGEPSAECARLAHDARVAVLPVPESIDYLAGEGCRMRFADGDERTFDTVYPVLGGNAQSGLAIGLGAEVDDNEELVVDEHLQTSVDGLYAIGDIVSALNQISVAVGHAAVAATAVHNRLPRNFREDKASQPEDA